MTIDLTIFGIFVWLLLKAEPEMGSREQVFGLGWEPRTQWSRCTEHKRGREKEPTSRRVLDVGVAWFCKSVWGTYRMAPGTVPLKEGGRALVFRSHAFQLECCPRFLGCALRGWASSLAPNRDIDQGVDCCRWDVGSVYRPVVGMTFRVAGALATPDGGNF